MDKKRIVFCLDYYYPHIGGAEILFQSLAEGLVRLGHSVEVVTQQVAGSPSRETVNGVGVTRVKAFGSRYLFTLAAIPALRRVAKNADVLHGTTFAAAFPTWLVSKLLRKPMVLTVHELWLGKWNRVSEAGRLSNLAHEILERMIYWVDYGHYVAVSEATKRDMVAQGMDGGRITVIYNGIDYGFWDAAKHQAAPRGGASGDYVFFFSGRPGVSKGLPYLLKALAAVRKSRPEARLRAVVGRKGIVRKGYEETCRLIEELGLGDAVELVAPVPYSELPGLVLSGDAVVVPSLSEGFGFAAVEACALGKPVIATDNASLPEVVSGRRLLVPPRDAGALADAMLKAMDGQWDETPPRRFPESETVRGHVKLYDSLRK